MEKPFFQEIASDWHKDIVLMVRDRLPKVLVVLFLLFIVQRVIQFFLKRLQRMANHQGANMARASQLRTMSTLIRGTAYSVIGFMAFLQILNLFAIPYTGLLASAGLLGVGVGLAAQSLFKDIINGIFIFVENQERRSKSRR
jgi:small conductance mechanosensitive channel